MPPPVLEIAAQCASLATVILLLENGAMLGRRTTHEAVKVAGAVKAHPAILPNAEAKGFDPSMKIG